VVTHQLQVERRTAKAHRPKSNALPLDHATNQGGRHCLFTKSVPHKFEHIRNNLNILFSFDFLPPHLTSLYSLN